MRRLVSSADEVASNVRRFVEEVARSPGLQSKLGHVHAWYAVPVAGGSWIFGPSKFVGYVDNTAKDYLKTFKTKADGRETERVLKGLSVEVDLTSALGRELARALEQFMGQWGRRPRSGTRISTVAQEPAAFVTKRKTDEAILSRISSDPEICGGRPCIRGTRMRVSDLVDMIAAGATREEILKDYPYISDDDISAALSYAARAIDHRVIRAA
jgi:uncharacterized protein (DUF433 family)